MRISQRLVAAVDAIGDGGVNVAVVADRDPLKEGVRRDPREDPCDSDRGEDARMEAWGNQQGKTDDSKRGHRACCGSGDDRESDLNGMACMRWIELIVKIPECDEQYYR